MRVGNFLANVFSIILHPFLMPFYSVLLLFMYTNFIGAFSKQVFSFLFPILLFSGIIPALFILVLKKARMIKDYALSNRFERFIPYLMSCFANGTMLYYFYSSHIYYWFLGVIAAPLTVSLAGFLINIFTKVSVHMLGIGGLLGVTLSVCYNVKSLNPFLLFIILFILAGCLAVSRLYLRQNSACQVYGGFIVGFAVSFLTVWGKIALSY
ncbi:hypothetical protein D0T53_08685 [Dysgonomonas sp. 216]|uniref:hypothetical protein n=1 Tax=Dysgonomonas sp. 216 TaxID=2302934 RepID=UPI0013D5A973|nr:hypothetical protein [Dysgonomonas sp. 216]NDW18985.1 hypothetical protein [Dysgonomonas sp. 216]